MPLARFTTPDNSAPRVGIVTGDEIIPFDPATGPDSIQALLSLPTEALQAHADQTRVTARNPIPLSDATLLAPIDWQEVWASGVTYSRSRDARMEESTQKDVYDLVYDAERPEIFMKATPSRVSGPGQNVAIRGDSSWDVPEPELVLVINSHGQVIGYTVGNDVSSRSIEGENPLYLPQAKVYTACAGLGPWIVLRSEIENPNDLPITLVISRNGREHFRGETSTDQIHRSFDELVNFLHRHNNFPHGVFLMTGTGIIPPAEFTLEHGDTVDITIDGIGTLTNPVIRLTE